MEILTVVPDFMIAYFDWGSNGFLLLAIVVGLVFIKVLNALKSL